jgi:hypothetical protein
MASPFGVQISSPQSFVTCAWEPAEKEGHVRLVAGVGGATVVNTISNQATSHGNNNFSGLLTAFLLSFDGQKNPS